MNVKIQKLYRRCQFLFRYLFEKCVTVLKCIYYFERDTPDQFYEQLFVDASYTERKYQSYMIIDSI